MARQTDKRQLALCDTKPCSHHGLLQEDVRNAGGDLIGRRCGSCSEVTAGYGGCAHCGKIGFLTFMVQKTGRRYCNRTCRNDEVAIETGKSSGK